MWKSRAVGEISKGRWEEWESRFCFSTLSTAPSFPQSSLLIILQCPDSRLAEVLYPWRDWQGPGRTTGRVPAGNLIQVTT